MSSVTSVSTTPGNSTAGDSKDQLDSPSDRVERLLQKYKVVASGNGVACTAVIHSSGLCTTKQRSSGGSTAVMVRVNGIQNCTCFKRLPIMPYL